MTRLFAATYLWGLRVRDRALTKLTNETERGSETIEKVIIAAAVIGIAAVVVAGITKFVTTEAGKLG